VLGGFLAAVLHAISLTLKNIIINIKCYKKRGALITGSIILPASEQKSADSTAFEAT
jgi:hypothetical protein